MSQFAGCVSGFVVLACIIALVDFLRIIPISLISSFVLFSAINLAFELEEGLFFYKYFKKDFYYFIATVVCCLIFGVADGLILVIFVTLVLIIKRSTRPTWHLIAADVDKEIKSKLEEI